MGDFPKPHIVVSKCLGFAHCRYNGLVISDDFVKNLHPFVNFDPICPEVEIGLGVPRNPIRVVSTKGKKRLMQSITNKDLTEKMNNFANSFLDSLNEVDGFILKNRSPSCGIKDVRVYPRIGKVASISKGTGFFGDAVLREFPYLPIEDEGRLRNHRIKEHFLTKLFTFSKFRELKKSISIRKLVQFHSDNKFLLMFYNQRLLRILGNITANKNNKPIDDVVKEYEPNLHCAFSKVPRYTSSNNVFMHALGYFKKDLSSKEKNFLLESLRKYEVGRIPLCVTTNLMKSWIIRFGQEYLMNQTFFEPYPEELITCFPLSDADKERDYWE
ncbi:YbgA family protein [[Eubacterium] cellulosolvens]